VNSFQTNHVPQIRATTPASHHKKPILKVSIARMVTVATYQTGLLRNSRQRASRFFIFFL
jgi:hypothetical protein